VRRISLKSLLMFVTVVSLIFALGAYFVDNRRNADIRRVFGGSAGVNHLRFAERVEVYRIQPPTDRDKRATELPKNYQVVSGPVNVPIDRAQKLFEILSDRRSYVWNGPGCMPHPGVRIDFQRGRRTLHVYLCYECKVLETDIDGEFIGSAIFDNSYPELVRWVQPLFPEDEKIQALDKQ
jgi:hypothetical protein